MAGPEPRDTYTPYPTVAPTTNAPNDTLSVRANPTDFGGQTGQAVQGLGQTGQKVGQDVFNTALQIQGMANEHEANQADMTLAVEGGKVYDQYKQTEGMAAVGAKDQAIQNYLAVNEKIRNSLSNPAAQKAYDMTATRRMSFTIQDMNSYAASQFKGAIKQGNSQGTALAIDQANRFAVASDDTQFGASIGDVRHFINKDFTEPLVGKYPNIPVTQNKDGTLTFDSSTQAGKIAQFDYDATSDKAIGEAWNNRVTTLALDPQHGNVAMAVKLMEDNKDKMPASTYAQLSAKLHGPYVAEQSHQFAEDGLAKAQMDYNGSTQLADSGDRINNAIYAQESNSGRNTSANGVSVGGMQITPDTFKQFAHDGEDINNPDDNRRVGGRIIQKYEQDYNGDAGRVATAYFSGPGNVAPQGSSTPYINDYKDKNGKSVSSYVQDIQKRMGTPGTGYMSQADYLGLHESEIVQQTRDDVAKAGFGVEVQDQAAARVQGRISEIKSYQANQSKASADNLSKFVLDPQHPVTNAATLDYSQDPQVKSQWVQLQTDNPLAANSIRNLVKANAAGQSANYGTDFYNHLQGTLNGREDPMNLGDAIGGSDYPVSNSGFLRLRDEHAQLATPQGQAFAKAESSFLQDAYKQITGVGTFPGVSAAVGMPKFNHWLQQALPQIQAARSKGLSPAEIFNDPKSQDYLGKSIVPMGWAEGMKAQQDALLSGTYKPDSQTAQTITNGGRLDISGFKKEDESKVLSALASHRITKQEATDWAVKNGLASPNVPLPQ